MATVYQQIDPRGFTPSSTSAGPAWSTAQGTNFPVLSLAFDAAAVETAFASLQLLTYGSGNLTLTLNWYADTASSGDVIWGAAIACITPDADTQDIETKAFATATTTTDTHLGTTGQRLHQCAITISNLDGAASGDWVALKLYRDAAAGGDTMAGDALVVSAVLSYSDV